MTDGQDILAEPTRSGGIFWTISRALCAAVLAAIGAMLLIATKSTAGAAFVCSALILLLPIGRLFKSKRLAIALRGALIAVLCTIAIRSIGNTDIVPGQATTGYDFADRAGAIFQRFLENIGAKTPARHGPEKGPHVEDMDGDD
jgi:hypothetical protein